MKNPMTPAGIEPATFRFVAQRYRGPPTPHSKLNQKQNTGYGYGFYVPWTIPLLDDRQTQIVTTLHNAPRPITANCIQGC